MAQLSYQPDGVNVVFVWPDTARGQVEVYSVGPNGLGIPDEGTSFSVYDHESGKLDIAPTEIAFRTRCDQWVIESKEGE